ncbi:MAG: lactate utilization protein [Desulfobacteraceae bacterium]|nr:MAG: lactate utilization protein [Desulfobacteraceae bacterium]
MKITTRHFKQTASQELGNARTQKFLQILPLNLAARRQTAFNSFPDPNAAHQCGAAIRGEAVARLPELLEQFEKNAQANGAQVFWAADSATANRYIADLARAKGVRYVTKGKSMITEELGLNEMLAECGITPWETDLGEFIAQLLEKPPFHIVGPAINIAVEQIRDIFMQKGVMDEATLEPVALGKAARRFLRDKFRDLHMGITGVNIAVAETGTLINVENEGNIRFNKSSARILVCVMSLEKVVPSMADALHMLRLLCRSATGQAAGAYISMDSGPKKPDEIDGPEELHIIILDNGRSALYQDPRTREVLRCIRCGACLNACPVYGKVGGYPYGWAYSGPMGQVLMPALRGLEGNGDLIRACTLCHRCKTICPAGIDHPDLLLYYRYKDVQADPLLMGQGTGAAERLGHRLFALAAGRYAFWRLLAKCARLASERFKEGEIIHRMSRLAPGWFHSRDLPALPRKTFHERWLEREKSKGA